MNEITKQQYLQMSSQERKEYRGNFKHNLAELRKASGLTWREMANLLGLSLSQYGKIERNESGMTLAVCFALSSFFHVSVNELLGMPLQDELMKFSSGILDYSKVLWKCDKTYLSMSMAGRAQYTFPCRNFYAIRMALRLNRRQIEKYLDIPAGTWRNWEMALTNPRMAQNFYLASVFGISVNRLLGIPDDDELIRGAAACRDEADDTDNHMAHGLIGEWANILNPHLVCELDRIIEETLAAGGISIPLRNEVFRPFLLTPPATARVMFLNSGPRLSPKSSDGLAISAGKIAAQEISDPEGRFAYYHPKDLGSLLLAYKEGLGLPEPRTNSLTPWAEQGVLLLNLRMVRLFDINREAVALPPNLAESLARLTIKHLACQPQPVVFVLCSKRLSKFKTYIESLPGRNNQVLRIQSLRSGGVPGDFFPKVNAMLSEMGAEPINWTL